MGPRMSSRDEEGPIRRGLTLEVAYENGVLRLRNRDGEPIKIDKVVVEYTLQPLSYERREACRDRRVVEELRMSVELLPGAELKLRLRDVEKIEKVCVEAGDMRECYHPGGAEEAGERTG